METRQIFALILIAIIAVCVFLIIRGIVLWYFKIDDRTKLAKEQNQILSEIRDLLKTRKAD